MCYLVLKNWIFMTLKKKLEMKMKLKMKTFDITIL